MHLLDADLVRQVADLGLTVTGDDHELVDVVVVRQVRDELVRGGTRLVTQADHGRVGVVDEHDGLHAGTGERDELAAGGVDLVGGATVGDADVPAADHAGQALAGAFGDLGDVGKLQSALLGAGADGLGERVARVALDGGRQGEDLVLGEAGAGVDVGDDGAAVGERAGLVEHDRLHLRRVLEHARVLHDDAAARRQRDRADDGHRHADEQRARGGHDDDGEETHRVARDRPAQRAESERDDRVPGTEPVGETPDGGPILLGLPQHADDLRVARVLRRAGGNDGERVVAVDRTRHDLGALRLAHHVGLAGEVGLVHRAMPVDHLAVDRTQLVREHCDEIPGHDVGDGDLVGAVENVPAPQAVRRGRRAAGEGVEGAGRAFRRRLLQRLTAGEHEHDDRRDQPLPQQHGGDDGHGGEGVRTTARLDRRLEHLPHERDTAADDDGHQRPVPRPALQPESEPEDEMENDRRDGGDGDEPVPGADEQRPGFRCD